MLRPNFAITFEVICALLIGKQESILSQMTAGKPNQFDAKFVTYPTMVMTQTQNNLVGANPDYQSMNQNLDFLLNQWNY